MSDGNNLPPEIIEAILPRLPVKALGRFKSVDTDHYEHAHNPDCSYMFLNVYSLNNNSWRKLQSSSYDLAECNPMGGVLINGNLHWVIKTRPTFSWTIIAFNLEKEELTEIQLPDSVDYNKALSRKLVIIGGKLGFWGAYLGDDLWVMEEYGIGESWTKVLIHGDQRQRDLNGLIYNVDVDERLCRNVKHICGYGYSSMTYFESLVSPKCTRTL
ncbi:hypothetical protein L1887_16938 [Cichorium endivia]|nr:hypothetical protein L1887_16938 [Cichorium endivia]